ncbi:unnamed protein product [Cylicocyclus nassatus]|uniref:Uncharacterized protein n=1 Tax=Cylicocyclus nassatus TaxID=53992 RepID=A0AA36MEB6_CYLNA|nr:unnamed protein product [Cylicocyclus nassatus]
MGYKVFLVFILLHVCVVMGCFETIFRCLHPNLKTSDEEDQTQHCSRLTTYCRNLCGLKNPRSCGKYKACFEQCMQNNKTMTFSQGLTHANGKIIL